MSDITGKSILVTGGGTGIGKATALALTAHGARVTISGRREGPLTEAAREIGCRAVAGDITRAEDRSAMISAALAEGAGRLDAVVNNAGNMLRGPIEALSEAALLAVFNSNVIGAMMLTGLATPHLEKTRGSIIFLGSAHTRRAFPGACAYAATKGAIQTLTGVLAAELGPRGIRVNCVVPGGVLTQINIRAGVMDERTAEDRYLDMGRLQALDQLGEGRHVAEAIEHLILAQWTTGAILDVDGGLGLGLTRA